MVLRLWRSSAYFSSERFINSLRCALPAAVDFMIISLRALYSRSAVSVPVSKDSLRRSNSCNALSRSRSASRAALSASRFALSAAFLASFEALFPPFLPPVLSVALGALIAYFARRSSPDLTAFEPFSLSAVNFLASAIAAWVFCLNAPYSSLVACIDASLDSLMIPRLILSPCAAPIILTLSNGFSATLIA